MRYRDFEYNYTGINFILDLQVEVELEYEYPTYSTEGYRGFSFTVHYPEDLMVVPEERKRIEQEISTYINDKFIEMWSGDFNRW